MAGVNKAIIVGRLGKDPEMTYMPSGDAICNFSVATSDTWKDKATGEKKEKTEWHNIVVYRKLAEICGQYLTKGAQVYIEGKIQTRSWEQDGSKRYKTEIIAEEMKMLGGKGEGSGSGAGQQQGSGGGSRSQHKPTPEEDDIPF